MTDDRKHDTRECCDELARVWRALGDPVYNGASASEQVAEMRDALTAALDRAEKVESASQPFVHYHRQRTAKPLRGVGDSVHWIHVGTEWEAELVFSDIARLVAALEEP